MTECYTLLYYVREIESVKIILGCFLLIAGPSDRTASRRLGVICRRYLYLGEKNTRERRPRRGRSVTEEILPRRITKKGTNISKIFISKKEKKFISLPIILFDNPSLLSPLRRVTQMFMLANYENYENSNLLSPFSKSCNSAKRSRWQISSPLSPYPTNFPREIKKRTRRR